MAKTSIHMAGELAYYDGLFSLVPCRVLRVYGEAGEPTRLQVVVTAARPGYPRGLVLNAPMTRVWPRGLVRRRKRSAVLVGTYAWQRKAGV